MFLSSLILFHELIHLRQFYSKILIENKTTIIYNNNIYNKSELKILFTNYNERPWEIEALTYSKKFYQKWLESTWKPDNNFHYIKT